MTAPIKKLDLTASASTHNAPELDSLAMLAGSGVLVAPIMVVPASEQEEFYHNANLVGRLNDVFRHVDPTDPDEDDIYDLAPVAQELLLGNYLLDEVIDRFYDALTGMPDTLRVRRPGSPGVLADGARSSLLALKTIWAQDWSVDALLHRLETNDSFALEARPVLLHPADEPAGARLGKEIKMILGRPVNAHVTADNAVTRLDFTS